MTMQELVDKLNTLTRYNVLSDYGGAWIKEEQGGDYIEVYDLVKLLGLNDNWRTGFSIPKE